jgi:hypothetical protein
VCRGNHGVGPPLIEALEPALVELFGREQYERARADVLAGRDGRFAPPVEVVVAARREQDWAVLDEPPRPRTGK